VIVTRRGKGGYARKAGALGDLRAEETRQKGQRNHHFHQQPMFTHANSSSAHRTEFYGRTI
jgi:hypothetical protein